MDIRQRLQQAFEAEYREHLGAMRRLARPDAATAEIADVFRRAHSLKGAARAVDHPAIEALAHRLESLLELIQQGRLPMGAAQARAIQDTLDGIEDVAATPAADVDAMPVMAEMARMIDTRETAQAEVVPAAPAPVKAPPPSPPDQPPAAPAMPPPSPGAGRVPVRVDAGQLDRLTATSGRLLAQVTAQARLDQQLRQVHRGAVELRRHWERQRAEARRRGGAGADPRLDAIDRQVAALSRQLEQLLRSQGSQDWQMRQLVERLQDDIHKVRLVPAEEVFSGLGPMVRELARAQGKQIELVTSGLEIEADRMILQALKDPLMHVLRNAVDHGAEPPAERALAGKPAAARVAMAIAADGTRLRLVISDDGRGLDFERIRASAVAKGLVEAGAAAALPEQELARLLLRAGFSTTARVSSLSGRGIGLSVLQETVTRLQGEIELGPNRPHGMLLEISLPMSIVHNDLLLVTCHHQLYALPAHAIERVARIRAAEIETVEGQPVMRLGQEAVQLASLAGLLGIADAATTDSQGHCAIVLLRSGHRRLALVVDGLNELRQAAIQAAPAGSDPVVAGTLLLDGSSPILVLSPTALADQGHAGRAGGLALVGAGPPREPGSILVVDDSITTRTLEKSILEAEGFRVRLAVDGLDALDSLRREKADLVISDVQMPRLDGFGLLRAMKSDPAFASIPVIMVTSRDSAEEVERGMELGADAYVVKQRFEQRELLETILQFLDAP